MTSWMLPDNSINELQQNSIKVTIDLAKQAHYVNIHIRINGTWKIMEADWIKHLVPLNEQMKKESKT